MELVRGFVVFIISKICRFFVHTWCNPHVYTCSRFMADFRVLCLVALSIAVLQKFNKSRLPTTLKEVRHGQSAFVEVVAYPSD